MGKGKKQVLFATLKSPISTQSRGTLLLFWSQPSEEIKDCILLCSQGGENNENKWNVSADHGPCAHWKMYLSYKRNKQKRKQVGGGGVGNDFQEKLSVTAVSQWLTRVSEFKSHATEGQTSIGYLKCRLQNRHL